MLNSLSIRNFQSLRKVDLELGQFTVIVGPSSSGKSALIRACKALASNVRGSGVITRGQKVAAITATTEQAKVTLSRSETASGYNLRLPDDDIAFTKLAGSVPEAITKALRIEPVPASGSSVNFASQFDRPYLLDDTGATVARTLGDLTNVSTIFAAVRSANQVRATASRTLKTRKGDLAEVKTSLLAFQGLGDRLSALERAEELHRQADTVDNNIIALERGLAKVRLAELTLAAAQKLPEVPDATAMYDAYTELVDLSSALADLSALREHAEATERGYQHRVRVHEALQHRLAEALTRAKVCPTCGQSTIG